MDIVALAQSNDDLSTFVAAVEAADLVEPLRGADPFTVFAPSNAAFDALPTGTLEDLLKAENKERLTAILTYHVSQGYRAAAAELIDGMRGDTMNGARDRVSNDGTNVMGDDATVIRADLEASNGIVYVIDTVLTPG